MALGNNRDYKTNANRVNRNLHLHSQLASKFMAEGLSEEEASKKAAEFVLRPSTAYRPLATEAYRAGKLEREFVAEVPEGLRKGARKAFRMVRAEVDAAATVCAQKATARLEGK